MSIILDKLSLDIK